MLVVADAIDASPLLDRILLSIPSDRIMLFVRGSHNRFDKRKYSAVRLHAGEFSEELLNEKRLVIVSTSDVLLKENLIVTQSSFFLSAFIT